MMQLKADSAVRVKLWSDLLVSQTAEGRAGTENVCSPGKPEGAYGSVRRPHETAEGKELHLILGRRTGRVKQERRGRGYNQRILQNLTTSTHKIWHCFIRFLFFALVFRFGGLKCCSDDDVPAVTLHRHCHLLLSGWNVRGRPGTRWPKIEQFAQRRIWPHLWISG